MFIEVSQRQVLHRLAESELIENPESKQELEWSQGECAVERLGDRLGRAGFIDAKSRRLVTYLPYALVVGFAALSLMMSVGVAHKGKLIILVVGAAYLGFVTYHLFLRWRERHVQRSILFGLPIFLESVILVVESGVGLLPALSRVVKAKRIRACIVTEIFRTIYQLTSAGIPFGRALEMVSEKVNNRTLQHVMLHLELSGVEGGELIPSLRSLSEHVHKEWQLSVEERVKRLENLVVFPVFISVIGLVLLTAAVPLTSVLGLRDKLQASRGGFSEMSTIGSEFSSEEQ